LEENLSMKSQTSVTAHVDGERLWRSILEMAMIGATPNGGSSRIAFSKEDDDGRLLFKSWCEEAGLTVCNDAFGNMYALRTGREGIAPLMIGSHLDTQPKGGRFDGVLGVLGGLEVIRALNDAGVETDRPIILVNWTNEEGAVLTPMMGSAVFTGDLSLEEALRGRLATRETAGEALAAMRCGAGEAPTSFPIHAYLELHIEQGPVLEDERLQIGVVTGGIGFRRYAIRFEGQEAHAGPTPMRSRKDPMVAAARAIVVADDLARRTPEARATIGVMSVEGGSPNTVAKAIEFTLDFRHATAGGLSLMEAEFLRAARSISNDAGVDVSHQIIADSPPAPFDADVVSAVQTAANFLGFSNRLMVSGAGHDACNMSRSYATGMIFVPSIAGLSHNEGEFTAKEDCVAGVRVLAKTAESMM
jgi:N-carbamoyl-L-amino-acid hydrolase